MHEEIEDLLDQLCTQIGATMEDASLVALMIGRLESAEKTAALVTLSAGSERIARLLSAAQTLSE